MRTVSSAEAQNHFGELLDNAQREPISITRRGRPVAFVVSSEAYRALSGGVAENTEKMAAYLKAIESFRGQGQGGATERLLADRKADAAREA
ncbi:MAG: type II toxin-antitoxin system Phd/YefM family antitoxin [Sulfurimicrobium sp.]|nr:type II toxin-antitoxin system Phd/YefM family antitoxin [Sulfurimicrobium sp.]MDO9189767.1 type II toxin-antitoxin system Phd/YefM family antitoxin [Sulfurimicrobium sp.]MDP1898757.1 type II toxin-antitoxin system Phd/YefM family antitoxin [Sulfurimicrobium sp.]MDP2199302.1 type II toxin-antitoxin system Phd/YefM family antitoxin [Sulfurimicrobium sp.]MDP2963352.1 type II toxin-antitoxin system Phd/YefM family antitoxin [Sulfurimicrobium sp.]